MLAIGIVVDDAIVVVENVERNIEAGLEPREATYKAMEEVSGPIVAIALVLCAVFVPIAFVSGLTGQFYRQFALTIAISTVISAFNSLTLSPALAAVLLKSHDAPKDTAVPLDGQAVRLAVPSVQSPVPGAADATAAALRRAVAQGRRDGRVFDLDRVHGFLVQDRARRLCAAAGQELPDRHRAASRRRVAGAHRARDPAHVVHRARAPGGQGLGRFPGPVDQRILECAERGNRVLRLKDFAERRGAGLSGNEIAGALNQKLASIQDGFVFVLPPPPVQGLGTSGGFKMMIEDRADLGLQELYSATQALMNKARQSGVINPYQTFSSFQMNVPQLYADVDRVKAKQQAVAITDIFETMQIYLGSLYVNDFNRFGRTYQVIAQADAPFRQKLEDGKNSR